MTERSGWGQRLARWSIVLAVVALIIAAAGLTLARYDLIGKLAGFAGFVAGGGVAVLALVCGLVALIAGRGQAIASRGKLLAAMGASLIYVAFLASRPLAAGDAPAIHDITTDLADPPAFKVLALRGDNLVGVETAENWRRIHAAAYGDLKSVTIPRPVPAVAADAVALARKQGWTIAASDPAHGHVEATASVSYIRFHDDIAIRIVPSPDGKGSKVDMRSVSRVGVGDLGVNAARIRAFLKGLAGKE